MFTLHNPPRSVLVTARLLVAIPLGYFIVAQTVTTLAWLLVIAGMSRPEAVVLAAMLGFLVYLVWVIWAFAVRSLVRLYLIAALVLSLNLLLPSIAPIGA